jgi:hypothetical protein
MCVAYLLKYILLNEIKFRTLFSPPHPTPFFVLVSPTMLEMQIKEETFYS